MKNKFKIREVVTHIETKQTGIIISYSKTILCEENHVYSVFFPEIKEYKENIWEGDLLKIND